MNVIYDIITDSNNYHLVFETENASDFIHVILTSSSGTKSSASGVDLITFEVEVSNSKEGRNCVSIPLGYSEGVTSKLELTLNSDSTISLKDTKGRPPRSKPIELDTELDTGEGFTPKALGF